MKRVLLVVLVSGAAHALAFRQEASGQLSFWLWMLLSYVALAFVAVHYLWERGTLAERLRPRWGDLSIGAMAAIFLLVGSWLARSALAPTGTPRSAWLYRIYLQLGDPEALQNSLLLTGALLLITVSEELVWRGLVLDAVTARLGSRRGWVAATFLYALATVPTAWVLRDPEAGLNPLLPIAAFGAGLLWTFLAARTERLIPVIVSHMVFTYFSVVQFRWPGV